MVGFGEMITSAVVKELFGKLTSPIWKEIALQASCGDDLEAIQGVLRSIQAKLKDAERRSHRDASVRDLLKKLKAVAYDIEDRLVAHESSIPVDGFLNLENWSSIPDKIKSRYNLPREMKKMRERLEKIRKEMELTNFTVEDGASDEQDDSRFSEASLYSEGGVFGRDIEKGKIMDLLLYDEEHSTIPIYGLGGLGKTTLAQMIFYDSTTQIAFEMFAWVNVPKKLDLDAVRSSIIQQHGNAEIRNVSAESIIAEKRCLIVLDDIWEEDDFKLENLETMLARCKKGSKVIVTTRSKKVADRMNRYLQIELGLLPNKDCWTLFRKKAGVPTPVPPLVEAMRETILDKCQGLPLAVKSLGYLLRRIHPTDWGRILSSDIWTEDDGRFSDNKVLPTLKLSYYNMPSYLRLCFAYCSVFPKGSHIQSSSLIQQWIALGFIQPPESVTGEDCLRELIEMSFLQNVNMPTVMSARYTWSQSVLKMHDLVHKLASVVAADEVCIFHASDCSSSNTELGKKISYCRYMSISNLSDEQSKALILPCTARALHFRDCRKFPGALSETEFLRILDFSACTIDKLPDSISQLRLLKYLNISGMKTDKLPKALSKLYQLQALSLSKNTDLVELPSYICKFSKLHYLDLHGCSKLEKLPEDIDKLAELQHLNLSDCTSLKSLPSFSSSSGALQKLSSLNVSNCYQLQELPDYYMPNMIHLNMSFCPKLQELPPGLFKHMTKLLVLNFSGCISLQVLPEFGEDGTGCLMLEVLDLSGCANMPVLPESCTQLGELRFLNLSGCSQLQNFLNLIPHWKFGKLEYLNLSGVGTKGDSEAPGTSAGVAESSQDPSKEIELGMLQEDIITQGLFSLKYLSIGGFTLYSEQGIARMADLLTLPNFNVQQEDDGRCSNILTLEQILDLTHCELNIKRLENVVSSEEAKQLALCRKQHFHSLSFEWSLSDTSSSVEDEHLAKASAVLDNLRPHRYLKSLSIKGYICTAFPDWINKINDTLPNLVRFVLSDIKGCDYIPEFGHLPNLQELEINNIPQLRVAQIGPCKKLRRLTLVALRDETTVLLFHGCDREVRETGEEFSTLPGSLPKNQEKRKSKTLTLKGWFRALPFRASGETREKETLASSLSNISEVPKESLLSPKPSSGCSEVASAAFPELDYLKIERCHNIKLDPSLPKSKEYFIRDSSLSQSLDMEDTSSSRYLYARYTEGYSHSFSSGLHKKLSNFIKRQPTSGLKSKMYIEGRSHDHFSHWIGLTSTGLDELVITLNCSYRYLDLEIMPILRMVYIKYFLVRENNDLMGNIYGLLESCLPKLERLNLLITFDGQHRRPQSADSTTETYIGKIVQQVPYIKIVGDVALFAVKPIGGGILCSRSNISLLYKHHDTQSRSLVIENLENVKTPDEVQELANYHQLHSVSLVWSRSDLTEDSSMLAQDKAVLENLRPHQNLETLEIEGYGGDGFCYWAMNINYFLPNLADVKLSNMPRCQRLPSLGQLANLKVLHISDMPSVTEVDGYFYGAEKPFRKLRELKLNGMNKLEEWPISTLLASHGEHQLSQGDENFPNLQVLSVVNCPRMRFVPAFPGSRECTLEKSSKILASFEQVIANSNLALIRLEINDCGSSSEIVKFLEGSANLEHLTIGSCIDLITLPEPIRTCCSLKKLEIRDCWNFSALPDWLGEVTSLRDIEVQATKLTCLPQSIQCLTALERLVLNKCNYKLHARCTSGEDEYMIKHIRTFRTTEIPSLYFDSSDICLLQRLTSSHLIELHIKGLGSTIDLVEAENLKLRTKNELCSLTLSWGHSDKRGRHKAVLEKLQPHDGLEILCINNYDGADFPHWMSLLPNLVKLELHGIGFIRYLHLDQLWKLRELNLSSVKFGHLHLDRLENLRELKLSSVEFETLHLDRLPNLTELKLSEGRFEHLHLDQLENFRELNLSRVKFGHLHLDRLQNLRELNLSSMEFEQLHLDQLLYLGKLKLSEGRFGHFHLDQLENLRELDLSSVEFGHLRLDRLQNLRELKLSNVEFERLHEHLHLDQLENLSELYLSRVKSRHVHLDQLENLRELYLSRVKFRELYLSGVKFRHLRLDQSENLRKLNLTSAEFGHFNVAWLQNLRKLKLSSVEFEHIHLDQLENLRELDLSEVKFGCLYLDQLQNLELLYLSSIKVGHHLSQIESLGSNQPACIECTQPLRNLQRIVMYKIENQELKISMQGGEGNENLFPGLQHLEMKLCQNLSFDPSIPRSTLYTISGETDQFGVVKSSCFPLFKQIMGMSTPGSSTLAKMEIKHQNFSSQNWEPQHLELLNITELTVDSCNGDCPLPKCILGLKTSLRKLEILRCCGIHYLPEWLGEMTSLSELIIETCWMETLHPCIQRLTNLQTLTLSECTIRLKERCRDTGDDWINIRHIPNIKITDRTGNVDNHFTMLV